MASLNKLFETSKSVLGKVAEDQLNKRAELLDRIDRRKDQLDRLDDQRLRERYENSSGLDHIASGLVLEERGHLKRKK